jgi:uncharacterized protein (DUF2141 family)
MRNPISKQSMIHYFLGYHKINNISARVHSTLFYLAVMILAGCARPGTPTGGPKDETPPEVVAEIPPNRTVLFNSTKVAITFSEFVQLKDPAKEIFISPPMKTRPEFKSLGKKILIEFQEELKPNSTYTINFGSSITDYTEGNPLVNYEYVFSTGNHIDSLSIPGKILNGFDHQPVESIIVMVYQDDNDTIPLDSLPLGVPPKSASRTTKDGSFSINNLASGEYKLFALEDLNNNYIFDIPNERIAFLDSLVCIEPVEPADTSAIAADTTDEEKPAIQLIREDLYILYLFQEIDSTQKLLDKKQFGRNLLQYYFRMPADSVKISPIGFIPGIPDWYIKEFNRTKDTVNFWLRSVLPDTIRVCVSDGDSLADTSRYILSKVIPERLVKRKETVTAGLNIISNALAGALDLNKNFKLFFPRPIEDFEPEKLHLFTVTDTLSPKFSFADTLKRSGDIEYKWLPAEFYQLIIEDSAFCDLSGAYNDSTNIKFKVRVPEDYGQLLIDVFLPGLTGQYIVQLMSEKEILLQQQVISRSGQVSFKFLMPGKYKLKAIFDANSNGKWDTGNYRKNLLPERVEYYQTALSIRANWDLQEEWRLE